MIQKCTHLPKETIKSCPHLQESEDLEYWIVFTGEKRNCLLLCQECEKSKAPELIDCCLECNEWRIEDPWNVVGIKGEPEALERKTALQFRHQEIDINGLPTGLPKAIAPLNSLSGNCWLWLTSNGLLYKLSTDERKAEPLFEVDFSHISNEAEIRLEPSPKGEYLVLVNPRGPKGIVVELMTGKLSLQLERGDYHIEHCEFSIAWSTVDGKEILIHATDWNRLAASDPSTGMLLTPRETEWRKDEPRPAHYLDYFHCNIAVSPKGKWIVNDGWVWHPVGQLMVWDLQKWLQGNVYESEDGTSQKYLRSIAYYWDTPFCFIDEDTLAVWGYGGDDDWLINAAVIYSLSSGKRLRWFAGPQQGDFVFDNHLVVLHKDGTTVWDTKTGERLLIDSEFKPLGYHPTNHHYLSVTKEGACLLSKLSSYKN